MSNPPKILETLKSSIPFVLYVSKKLKTQIACDDTSIPANTDLVRDILTAGDQEIKSKLPSDAKSQEALYKAVAAQIKITEKIKGKEVLSEEDVKNILTTDPFIQEVIIECGVNNEEISEKINDFFKNLPRLSWCGNNRKKAVWNSKGILALSIIDTLEITNDELKILATRKIPLSLLPKLSKINDNEALTKLLKEQQIDLSLLELLPLLLRNSSFAAEPNPADSSEESPKLGLFPEPPQLDAESLQGVGIDREEFDNPLLEVLEGLGVKDLLGQDGKIDMKKLEGKSKAVRSLLQSLTDSDGKIDQKKLETLPELLISEDGQFDLARLVQMITNGIGERSGEELPPEIRETVENVVKTLGGEVSTPENKSSGTTEPPKRTWVKWVVGGGLTALALIGGLVWWKTT